MRAAEALGYFFGSISILAALYVALSRDLLRVTVAFFVELATAGGVLFGLNASYLALLVFTIGLMGSILVISFSSVITGSLKESFRGESANRPRAVTQALGMLLGTGLGVAIGWALLTGPFVDQAKWEAAVGAAHETDVRVLGRLLLGQQLAVFELLGVIVLAAVVGASLLLRKPENAD